MQKIKCYDVVGMIVDEATRQFSPFWIENSEKRDILKQYCEALDLIGDECDADSFEVEVDDINMTISIKVITPEIIIENKNHVFYSLMKRAIKVEFSHDSETEDACVEFVFPSIWDKSY